MNEETFIPGNLKKVKEGWLEKQSRHLKRWKRRYCLLTEDSKLYTFKDTNLANPTEIIDLHVYSSVKSSEDQTHRPNSFDVYCSEFGFSLVADSNAAKEDWIRAIGRQIVMCHTKSWQNDEASA